MTVQELIDLLKTKDPSTIVCVETYPHNSSRVGKYPLRDDILSFARIKRNGEFYRTVSLFVGDWP